jgi:hypothetical protein
MTKLIEIPPSNDPCWLMDDWRTERLLRLMAERNISIKELSRVTHAKTWTVMAWRSNKARPITAAMLRLVMFECNYGDLK